MQTRLKYADSLRRFWLPEDLSGIFTFSFLKSLPAYYNSDAKYLNGFQKFLPHQESYTRLAQKSIEKVADVSFVDLTNLNPGGNSPGKITYGVHKNSRQSTQGITIASAPLKDKRRLQDVWINSGSSSFTDNELFRWTILHETLHAINLVHPFYRHETEEAFTPLSWFKEAADIISAYPYSHENTKYTVMAYDSHPILGKQQYPTKPLLYDIAALQMLYGASKKTVSDLNSTLRDDTYWWSQNDLPLESIWDAGGIDEIDASTINASSIIDLREGRFSSIGLGNSFTTPYENISIAFGAVIENAEGSNQHDVIIGNSYSNELNGNDGDDIIFGEGSSIARIPGPIRSAFSGILDSDILSDDTDSGHYELNGKTFKEVSPDSNLEKDILDGGAGNDVLVGSYSDGTIIKGGAGNDEIISLGQNSQIFGGAGDDRIWSASKGTVIHTGAGKDQVLLSEQTLIADASSDDELYLRIFTGDKYKLSGGIKPRFLDTSWAVGRFLERYGISSTTGELVIRTITGKDTFIANPNVGPNATNPTAGLIVVESGFEVFRLLDSSPPSGWLESSLDALLLSYKAWTGKDFSLENWDPLVLDLDGDGIELTALTSVSPRFDLDGDRFAEETGWVQRDDALLVLDKNDNGTIDDINELFGIGLTSGFTELAALDSDEDGWFSAKDDLFEEVQIWQDKNQNALSEVNELTGLIDAGIQQISLGATAVTNPDIANNVGNLVAATASYQRTDGSTGTIADVRFMVDNYNSTYLTDTKVSDDAAALPEIKGYGVLPNLRIAMSESPAFLNTVIKTLPSVNSNDMSVLRRQAFPIFAAWGQAQVNPAGQSFGGDRPNVPIFTQLNSDAEEEVLDFALKNEDGTWRLASKKPIVDEDGREIDEPTYDDVLAMSITDEGQWEVLSGAELAFMERYFGELIPLSSASQGGVKAMEAVGSFLTTLQERLDVLSLRLAVQGPLAEFFPGIAYDAEDDVFVPTTERQLTPMFEVLLENAPSSTGAVKPYLESWQEIIRLFIANYDREAEGAKNTYSFIVANLVAAHENVGLATSVTKAAEALGVPEKFVIESNATTVDGTAEKDIFYISSSPKNRARTFNGGLEHDAYVVGRNFGNVIIADVEGVGEAKSPDMIRFAQLRSTDVEFNRDGIDLVVTDKTTGSELRVKEQFEGKKPGLGGIGDIGKDMTIQEISFADGVSLDFIEISRRIPKPSAANIVETGTAEIDFFDGGAGYDSYFDVEGGDVYIFGQGYAHDIINEKMSNALVNSLDYVQFKPDISLQDVRFELEHGTDDLHIYARDSGDILTLRDQYKRTETGPFGAFWFNQVELFSFDDGTTLDADTILQQVLKTKSTDGDDRLTGSGLADVLDGGLGNDFLAGADNDDTYVFGKNYGFDYVDDTPGTIAVSSNDTILFTTDVTPEDVTFRRVYNDYGGYHLLVGFTNDNSQLFIENQLSQNILGSNFHRIENFQFQDSDATSWSWQDVQKRVLQEETVDAKAVQFGTQSADVLSGSGKNDIFSGGDQSDTYRFGRGSGVDVIQDKGNPPTGNDNIVEFTKGVSPTDVKFSYGFGEEDLVIDIVGTNDRLIIRSGLTGDRQHIIKAFHFDDGTVVPLETVQKRLSREGIPAGNEVLNGSAEGGVLNGGDGNDILKGKGKIDTYVFGYDYGVDVIDERANSWVIDEANVLQFAEGVDPEDVFLKRDAGHSYYKALNVYLKGSNDVLLIEDQFTVYQNSIHQFKFADGTKWSKEDVKDRLLQPTEENDTLIGFYRADTLTGGTGQDYLSGRHGSDIYEYNLGDGADIIEDNGYASDKNIIRFSAGITPENTTLHRSQNHTDFHITFGNNQDRLTVIDAFSLGYLGYYGSSAIDRLEFDDGTRWTVADIQERLIQTTVGDDYIVGFAGEDTLQGGKGNDYLSGRGSNDTYLFNLGDGHDVIADYNYSSAGTEDNIKFGPGITPEKLFLRREDDDLIINIKGQSDWLTVRDQFNSSYGQIEKFSFANGDAFTLDELQALVDRAQDALLTEETGNVIRGDANDNKLKGTIEHDLIYGGDGNDRLIGRQGNDSLTGGDGNDNLIGGDGEDLLRGEAGRDRLIGGNSDDQLFGGIGRDFLTGQAGDDFIQGDEGNDVLQGGSGSDTFVLAMSMGRDTIRDFEVGVDLIGLADGLTFGSLSFNRRGSNSLIQLDNEIMAVVRNVSELDASSFISID